jgi:uncharacterized protein (UPF0548 family)
MFCLNKPGPEKMREFLSAQKQQQFSYTDIGASRTRAPGGYVVDRNRIQLGEGRAAFERAKNAIKQWKMFDISWLELFRPDTPIEEGATVAILVSHLGFWSLNAARIVYTIEERGAPETYGFAYGTLHDHAEMGEERFTVGFHAADETVWHDLYASSSPHALTRLALSYTRALQKKFASDSKKAMLIAVRNALPTSF